MLCCDGWTSTKRPPLGDLVLHLLEAGATFKLVQWNCVNKPQKVLWVQKGSSLALFIHWHLIYSSFSYSVVLEDKFTLPNGKKKPKPKSASQTRNKLNEIRLMWGNTKSYPGKKTKSCAVDCKSSHACWEWTLTATSCVGLFLFVIFEQSGAAQPIVWAEEQHRKVAWAARSALSPPLNSWKSCQTPFPAQTQPSNGFVSAFIDGLGCVHSWQTTQGTFFGSSSFYQNISPHL